MRSLSFPRRRESRATLGGPCSVMAAESAGAASQKSLQSTPWPPFLGDGEDGNLGDTPNPGSILLHMSCHPSPFVKGGFQGLPENGGHPQTLGREESLHPLGFLDLSSKVIKMRSPHTRGLTASLPRLC